MSRGNGMRVAVAVLLLATACGGPERSPDDPQVQAEALAIWRDRCASCHGLDGEGDGPQGRHLAVRPRRLSDRAWQASVTDEHLRTVIVQGGPAVGRDLAMAPNPDLGQQPAVLEALVRYIRHL